MHVFVMILRLPSSLLPYEFLPIKFLILAIVQLKMIKCAEENTTIFIPLHFYMLWYPHNKCSLEMAVISQYQTLENPTLLNFQCLLQKFSIILRIQKKKFHFYMWNCHPIQRYFT